MASSSLYGHSGVDVEYPIHETIHLLGMVRFGAFYLIQEEVAGYDHYLAIKPSLNGHEL